MTKHEVAAREAITSVHRFLNGLPPAPAWMKPIEGPKQPPHRHRFTALAASEAVKSVLAAPHLRETHLARMRVFRCLAACA